MIYSRISLGIKVAVCSAILLGLAVVAHAAPTSCGVNYYSNAAPDILVKQLKVRTVELCHDGFGVVHSGVTATPLWSAQHLTAQRVIDAKQVARVDNFYPEPALSTKDRAELGHYSRSGFDRGHLAPSADMATATSQANSFSLSNIFPQQPELNRKLWAEIEATTRGLALRYDDVYVVTGVAFQGELKALRGRVYVPSAVYKAIYIPSVDAAAVWWAPNVEPGSKYEVISIDELSRRASVDVFPQIDARVKAVAVKLPKPSKYADRAAGTRSSSKSRGQTVEQTGSTQSPQNEDPNAALKEIGKRLLIEAVKGALK